MLADSDSKKKFPQKTLNFHLPKIRALAPHTDSLELESVPTVKSRQFDRIFCEKQNKILRLKMTRKKSLQDVSIKLIPIF
jgi:hypothetical protein